MKILVPIDAVNNGLSDRELVLCNLMLSFMKDNGRFVRYYIHTGDLKRILGKVNATFYDTILEGPRKVFTIGILNSYTATIEYKTSKQNIHKNGSIVTGYEEINDLDAIRLYYYLIGRQTGSQLVEDRPEKQKMLYDTPSMFVKESLIPKQYFDDMNF